MVSSTESLYPPGGLLPSNTVALLVDGYERLSGRVLDRMQELRHDVDADLAALRSEVSSLRTAVEDVADRVQLRQMRSSIDELRSDIAGLRSAVLEWPELERVSSDVSALRSATTELQTSVSDLVTRERRSEEDTTPVTAAELNAGLEGVSEALEKLQRPQVTAKRDAALTSLVQDVVEPSVLEIRSLLGEVRSLVASRPPAAEFEPLVEELAQLRTEMVNLKRRIALRAGSEGPTLRRSDIEAIADAVARRFELPDTDEQSR